jgi:hypothetical protein
LDADSLQSLTEIRPRLNPLSGTIRLKNNCVQYPLRTIYI